MSTSRDGRCGSPVGTMIGEDVLAVFEVDFG